MEGLEDVEDPISVGMAVTILVTRDICWKYVRNIFINEFKSFTCPKLEPIFFNGGKSWLRHGRTHKMTTSCAKKKIDIAKYNMIPILDKRIIAKGQSTVEQSMHWDLESRA